MDLLVGCESEENEVEEYIWWEGDGRGDGKWEAALEEELLMIEHRRVVSWGHECSCGWVSCG